MGLSLLQVCRHALGFKQMGHTFAMYNLQLMSYVYTDSSALYPIPILS